jgi:hypothetical protein
LQGSGSSQKFPSDYLWSPRSKELAEEVRSDGCLTARLEPLFPGLKASPIPAHTYFRLSMVFAAVEWFLTRLASWIKEGLLMMKSVANVFSNLAMGIILTGMGSDGAEGMQAIYRRGGFTLGQDEASCTVYGMPRACAELNILSRVVPLSQIPAVILQLIRYRKRA